MSHYLCQSQIHAALFQNGIGKGIGKGIAYLRNSCGTHTDSEFSEDPTAIIRKSRRLQLKYSFFL